MSEIEWDELLIETEKYSQELKSWVESTGCSSRLDLYKEIDTYPINTIAKMHLATNYMLVSTAHALARRSGSGAKP